MLDLENGDAFKFVPDSLSNKEPYYDVKPVSTFQIHSTRNSKTVNSDSRIFRYNNFNKDH